MGKKNGKETCFISRLNIADDVCENVTYYTYDECVGILRLQPIQLQCVLHASFNQTGLQKLLTQVHIVNGTSRVAQ